MVSHLRKRRRGAPAVERLEDRTVPTLLGNSLFPADYPWNQQITNAPVASNSTAIINNIISDQGGDGRLHPDFGQDYQNSNPLYGIPYNVVHGNSTPKVHVVINAYASQSDLQDAPIPANAVLEGDLQNGPTVGLAKRGDSHLLVYDVDNNVAYEFYHASRPSENGDGQWHADQETVWNMNTDQFRTLGWTSADAAGLAVLPGLVRPDEGLPVSQGGQGVINHAIRFTLQNSIILDQFLYPASHTANPGNTNAAVQPPMGARFRLKAGVDISQLNPESKVIAQAMKDYGLVLADNGSNFFFTGASYSVNASNGFALTWNDDDIQDSVHGLKSLTFSDFEVVSLTPVVTGLSAASGLAGTALTITGQNFSGAAGRLQVLFGTTPATNVTVVDDGHVTATVPAGSGAVDVRVQSGVADPSDPSDFTSPIFGYGISAVTAADRFTVTTPPVALAQAPRVNGNLAGLAGAQRSLVDQVVYTFNHAVSLAANAFTIALHPNVTVNGATGQAVGTLPALGWGSADGGVTWVVTFSGNGVVNASIADGVYDLTLHAAAVSDAQGQTLAANRVDTFYRLYGDTNGDGAVNASDALPFKTTFLASTGNPAYLAYLDYNGDGIVNSTDALQFKRRFLTSYGGFTATL